MASSKVMASTSTTNPDRPRHHLPHSSPSSSSFLTTTTTTSSPSFTTTSQPPQPLYHSTSSFGSVNMEDILKNMYTEPDSLDAPPSGSVSIDGPPTGVVVLEPRMTLEDFLTKAGAVSEDDVRVPPPSAAAGVYGGADAHAVMGVQFPAAPGPVVHVQNGDGVAQLRYGNGMVAAAAALIGGGGGGGGGRAVGGRGKRRGAPVEELVLDKATQQKQKRMIKNRESAARSRERKQAYTVELETLVTQLEAENARLLQQEAEQNEERLKQLMENLIPVVEKRRPPRSLRRVNSMSW